MQQFLDTDGNVVARRSMVVDITERKQLEMQLAQSHKMEAVGQLAGGIAHDFNNLLTAIVGYADLASVGQLRADTARRYIGGIKTAAERATELTRQLLTFSRRQVIVPVVLDLNALVIDLNSMLRRLIGEDVELAIVTSADLAAIEADRGQIEQVIMNLVINARDAMPNGGKLTIETSTEQLDERHTILNAGISPGAYNVLTVTDTGVGMTEEVQDHIFEPFFTTKGVGEGTGLGLSTCYGIVTQSGGHITVDSQPGEGTSFKIYLPRVEEKPITDSRLDEKRSWPTGNETILLVEDEPLVRSLMVEVLESQGYNILQASNGAEAVRIAGSQPQEPIDLLLTDIVMPLMGGTELATRFRILRPEAKIIYMSGYPKDLPESGAEFIEKPTMPDILVRRVRSVLDSEDAPSDST
ncbi:MAG: ATP-binding protein [SAR202 cluster bacterium]|nr:ATP-binding protein [SAR202 cluster bacterium]